MCIELDTTCTTTTCTLYSTQIYYSTAHAGVSPSRLESKKTSSNQKRSMSATYRSHEKEKKRQYEQRVREIEHSSFCPLVFSLTGGLAPIATTFYKRLASQLSEKWKQPYGPTMRWLRCRTSFSLLRSCIMCIRGARSSANGFNGQLAATVDLTIADTNLNQPPSQPLLFLFFVTQVNKIKYGKNRRNKERKNEPSKKKESLPR